MKRCRRGNGTKASSQKKKSAKEETKGYYGTTISDLTPDVLTEIFLRLPSTSIICCKVVCKAWNNLLSRSHFCMEYLKISPYISLLHYNLIANSQDQADAVHLISLKKNYKSSQEPICSKRLNLPMKDHLSIVGSCNGLLHLVQYATPITSTCIANPMTGEYICLPRITASRRSLSIAHGFGFSTHYKAICIETYRLPKGDLGLDCQIFTIGVDIKWRQLVVGTSEAFCVESPATILNGAFHWLVDHESALGFAANNSLLLNSICAFDIAAERFRPIPPPPGDIISNGTECLSLGELKGHLCVFDGSRIGVVFDVWMMNEYGNAESWTKNYVLRSWIPSARCYPSVHLPTASWRDGELMAHCTRSPHLISFNLREQKAEVLDVPGYEGVSQMIARLIRYVPNFLQLKDAVKGKCPKIQKVQGRQF